MLIYLYWTAVKRNLEQDGLEDVDDIVSGPDQKRLRYVEIPTDDTGVVDENHIVVTGMQVEL